MCIFFDEFRVIKEQSLPVTLLTNGFGQNACSTGTTSYASVVCNKSALLWIKSRFFFFWQQRKKKKVIPIHKPLQYRASKKILRLLKEPCVSNQKIFFWQRKKVLYTNPYIVARFWAYRGIIGTHNDFFWEM